MLGVNTDGPAATTSPAQLARCTSETNSVDQTNSPGSNPMGRWLKVLSAFVERDEWGVRELAGSIGLPRSAVHRILHDMVRLGLLAPTSKRGQFRPGHALARLAVLLADRVDVRRLGRPILEATMGETGETTILALYAPARRQFWAVDAAESGQTIRYIWESLREWGDLHVGSSGKGILAFLPESERESIIESLPDPIPGLRPIAKADLRAELAQARRRGYVVSHGERFAGAVGVSAPIRDAMGRVVGDLIISWPDNRTSPKKETEAARVVVVAAQELSSRLGSLGPDGNDSRLDLGQSSPLDSAVKSGRSSR
jgi:DNA-binding IclR family transcriptional regulator